MTTAQTIIPDYKNLKVGQRFYYTGDAANSSDFGEIIATIPATHYTQFSYKCKFDSDGRERIIMFQSFSPSPGQRFKTIEQHNNERAQAMESLYKQFPHLRK